MNNFTSYAKPLVSICIPSYNHSKYVVDLLDSIAADPYEPKEILVLDDGSSDNSLELMKAWKARVAPAFSCEFRRQENAGVCVTLNRLLGFAKGEWAVLVASDDILIPGGIGKRIEAITRHKDCVAVFGDAHVVDQDGKRILESGLVDLYRANKAKYHNPDSLLFQVVIRWSVPGPVLMVKRMELIEMGGFTDGLLDDYDIYLRLADRRQLCFIDDFVASYRLHPNNLCRSGDADTRIRKLGIKTCLHNFTKVGLRTKIYLVVRILMSWVQLQRARLGRLFQ